ncbi:MAG: TIGR02757 family protein [Melioribacteraceae bacterium]|nr:TIGR02757 family protein [Saprospiraceae bacterium]MCF8356616.1 TIGR02757 family protein [Melioribacteraceae bacterium]MCF8396000.1 TIGR02757 family protein [Melioribacteraceae bacterium]
MNKKELLLKQKLEYHYKAFDKSQLMPDPLQFPHRFEMPCDIEISGLISSVLAYGNIKQIINSLERIHKILGASPYDFVMNFNYEKERDLFKDIKHRFYTPDDIAVLFHILHEVYNSYGSLRYLFLMYHFPEDKNLKNSIYFFSKNLLSLSPHTNISRGVKFMFPDPMKGSACKRMNLFLRWMIRKDDLDFGIWEEVQTGKLVIPVDTHIAKICKKLKLTKTKNVSWKMAEEITENLKKFNKRDPVKYDFAICHIGIRKIDF